MLNLSRERRNVAHQFHVQLVDAIIVIQRFEVDEEEEEEAEEEEEKEAEIMRNGLEMFCVLAYAISIFIFILTLLFVYPSLGVPSRRRLPLKPLRF